MNGLEVGAGKHDHCGEAVFMGRFSVAGFELIDQKVGQENMASREVAESGDSSVQY